MEQIDRLMKNAYLFEHPQSYQAGVRDAIAVLERSAEQPSDGGDASEGRAQG